MNVVGYIRYSSENQRDGYSVEAQERAIKEFCEKEHHNLVRFYIDEALTGTTDNRPEFLAMIKDSELGGWDAVVVHKFDRFARNRYDSAIYKRQLRNCNVKLISVLEHLDDSPESIILETLLEGMAEYYSKNLAREVKKGLKENALGQKHNGGTPPLGYDVDDATKKLVVNNYEAEIIREIFKLYASGKPILEIANILNNKGYKTKSTKKKQGVPFVAPTIRSILRNEKYIGTLIYFGKKHVKTRTGSKNVKQSKENTIVFEDAIQPIVDKQLWDDCQKRLNENTYNTTRAKVDYLLTGLMYCADCGSPYVGGGSVPIRDKNGNEIGRHSFYVCSEKRKNKTCKSNNVGKERIETAVVNAIIEHCYNDTNMKQFAKEFVKYIKQNNDTNEKDVVGMQEQLKKYNKQKANIVNLAIDGVLNSVEAKEQKEDLEKKIKVIETQLNSILQSSIPTEREVVKYMEDTRDKLLSGSYNDYGALIRSHVHKITAHNGYQVIELTRFPYLSTTINKQIMARNEQNLISDTDSSAKAVFTVSLIEIPKEFIITLRLNKGESIARIIA